MNQNKNNNKDNSTDSFSIKKIAEDKGSNLQYDLKRIYADGDGKMPDISRLDKKRGSLILKFLIWLLAVIIIGGGLTVAGFYLFNWSAFNGDHGKIIMRVEGPQAIESGEEIVYKIVIDNQKNVFLKEGSLELQYPMSFTLTLTDLEASNQAQTIFKIPDIAPNSQTVLEIKGQIYGEPESEHTLKAVYAYKPSNFNSVFTVSALQTLQITSSPLEITIAGPTKIGIEEEAVYEIKYLNKSEKAFANLQFNLILPKRFKLAEEKGEASSEKGSGGTEGTEGSKVTDATKVTDLGPEGLGPKGVTKASEGAEGTKGTKVTDVTRVAEATEELKEDKSEEKRIINGQWVEEKLEPEQEETMSIKGKFDESASGEQEIGVEVKIKNEKGDFLTIAKQTLIVNVIKGDLDLDLFLNGSGEDQTISFGQALNFTLNYKNKSDFDMEGIKLAVKLDSSLVDWQSLNDKNEGEVLADEISWTSKQISELAFLETGEEGGIDWSVDLKSIEDIKKSELTEAGIKVEVKAIIAQLGEEETEITIKGPQLDIKVNTDLSLKASVRYFSEMSESLGSGPVPPKVGEKTTYHVFWILTNSLHEVENIKVTTILPAGISWENDYDLSAGQFDFDSAANTVTWEINWLPLGINVVEAHFEVGVTPVQEDLNKLLVLTQENKLTATDKITKGEISQTLPALTSELEADPIIEGKGLVVE